MGRPVNRIWFVAVLMSALMGCQSSREARADPIEGGIDAPFTLHGGQETATFLVRKPARLPLMS